MNVKKMNTREEERNRTLAMQKLKRMWRIKSPFLVKTWREFLQRYCVKEEKQATLF